MMYVLICVCLSLAGFAAFQLFYLLHLGRVDQERKNKIKELERRNKYLVYRLEDAEAEISEQNKLLETYFVENEDEEVWADVID